MAAENRMRLEHQLAVLEAIDFRLHILRKSLSGLMSPRYRLKSYLQELSDMEKKIALLETAKEEIQSKNWP